MAQELKLGCRCGQLQGVLKDVKPGRGLRARCHCRSCQTYAQHLGQADTVLDAYGGTEIFQTTLGGLSLSSGQEQLACLRISPKGPLRWYARCCNTPIANTLPDARLPFVALPSVAWQGDADSVLGTKTQGIWGRYAQGQPSLSPLHPQVPPRMLLQVAAMLLKARLRGEHRDTPFFDAANQPVVRPELLSREQRAAAEAALG